VLFKQRLWDGLRDGSITVTYRRWKRLQVVVGNRYRTGGGVLEVDAVTVVDDDALTDAESRRAGYPDRATLVRELDRYPEGDLYRIEFHHAGEDPRAALRQDADLTDADHEAIAARLARLDRVSPRGPWTRAALDVIAAHPEVRAGDLAASLGRDRASFKLDVRKLKELGLTESLDVGYRLSPRGRAVLDRLPAAGQRPKTASHSSAERGLNT
jgi:hypothetical protein